MPTCPLDGQVAVVTGAGAGLGRQHAELLARLGAAVVVNDVKAEAAAEVVEVIRAAGGTAAASGHDVSDPDQARQLINSATEGLGGLHIVVTNAGVIDNTPFEDMSLTAFDRVMKINAYGTVNVLHAAWPILLHQGHGRVVVVSSTSAVVPSPGLSHYAASKGAVLGLARTLAAEGGPRGVLVNVLVPGALTGMSAAGNQGDEAARRWAETTMSPHLVSPAVAWLALPTTTVNGEIIEAAAGRVAVEFVASSRGYWSASLTVEDVVEHAEEIVDRTDFAVLTDLVALKEWMTLQTTGWAEELETLTATASDQPALRQVVDTVRHLPAHPPGRS